MLPASTEFNRRVPKRAFYDNININPRVKRAFVEQVSSITWQNKIAPETVAVAPGSYVTEVEVFRIQLNDSQLDENLLRCIDGQIPYHIVFLLEYAGKCQAWTAYKEATTGNAAFKVNQYFHTDWMSEEALPLKLEGLTMDAIYENLVYQIAGDTLQAKQGENLQAAVAHSDRKRSLEKQIEVLQAKIRKEKQLNVQMKLNTELKKLKKELEVL